jgi:hypothetical protein
VAEGVERSHDDDDKWRTVVLRRINCAPVEPWLGRVLVAALRSSEI